MFMDTWMMKRLGGGAYAPLPASRPKFNILFVADLQPSHLSSYLHGKSEAYEHRLLHMHRARALRRCVPWKVFFKYET